MPSPYTDAAHFATRLLLALQRTKARRERHAGGEAAQTWEDAVRAIRHWRDTQETFARLATMTPEERIAARHHGYTRRVA